MIFETAQVRRFASRLYGLAIHLSLGEDRHHVSPAPVRDPDLAAAQREVRPILAQRRAGPDAVGVRS